MSLRRSDFFSSIDAMMSITENELMLDVFPVDDKHNITARILRHGIAVSAFSLLEKYLNLVFYDMVKAISRSRISSVDFPQKMQKFIIVDSVVGFNNRLSFIRDGQDKIKYVRDYISDLYGFMMMPPSYTANGFSPTGSNVGHEDVKKAFQAFLVSNPWGKMDVIAKDIGAATISLENEYKTLARSRHEAAHEPTGNIPTATLQAHLKAATTIAITADLLARAVGSAIASCRTKTKLENDIGNAKCRYRFLDEALDGRWVERKPNALRAVRIYNDRSSGVLGVSSRNGAPPVIVRNARSQPVEVC